MVNEGLSERGYLVLTSFFDPAPLVAEVATAFSEGFRRSDAIRVFPAGRGTVTTRYIPMMSERTPVSLALVDRLAETAAVLVGRPVLPGRAKGSRYYGDSSWHRDSTHDITSIGCVAYLEPVTADTGALRVVPGSHRRPDDDLPHGDSGTAVDTDPGDVIMFDERLIHGSEGGTLRHQWRIDYVLDPTEEREMAAVRAWYQQSLPVAEPEAGYDTDLYPSWGTFWQALDRPWSASLRRMQLIP